MRHFVFAQQTGIDENGGKLIADGAVYQGSCHAGIYTAADGRDHFLISSPLADLADGFIDDVLRCPIGAAVANIKYIAAEDLFAAFGVMYFRMELNTKQFAGAVFHASKRTIYTMRN
ncbi:hypothetical protein SDC9_201745 [bioreactor metagenome]|uniref:Uncharacterized protein n=1 Tax=bioreactor metagenome TaxID=1076179 RepID=A0A645ISI5_9ZZZZ